MRNFLTTLLILAHLTTSLIPNINLEIPRKYQAMDEEEHRQEDLKKTKLNFKNQKCLKMRFSFYESPIFDPVDGSVLMYFLKKRKIPKNFRSKAFDILKSILPEKNNAQANNETFRKKAINTPSLDLDFYTFQTETELSKDKTGIPALQVKLDYYNQLKYFYITKFVLTRLNDSILNENRDEVAEFLNAAIEKMFSMRVGWNKAWMMLRVALEGIVQLIQSPQMREDVFEKIYDYKLARKLLERLPVAVEKNQAQFFMTKAFIDKNFLSQSKYLKLYTELAANYQRMKILKKKMIIAEMRDTGKYYYSEYLNKNEFGVGMVLKEEYKDKENMFVDESLKHVKATNKRAFNARLRKATQKTLPSLEKILADDMSFTYVNNFEFLYKKDDKYDQTSSFSTKMPPTDRLYDKKETTNFEKQDKEVFPMISEVKIKFEDMKKSEFLAGLEQLYKSMQVRNRILTNVLETKFKNHMNQKKSELMRMKAYRNYLRFIRDFRRYWKKITKLKPRMMEVRSQIKIYMDRLGVDPDLKYFSPDLSLYEGLELEKENKKIMDTFIKVNLNEFEEKYEEKMSFNEHKVKFLENIQS